MFVEQLHSLQTFELACLTVLVGVLVTVFILRVCGVNPGGILGAAFLILAASDSVIWAVALVVIAPIISWLYGLFLSRIYRGREPIIIMAFISVVMASTLGMIARHFHIIHANSFSFPLGIILPAIIASAIHKQGLILTYRYLALALVLTLESLIIIHNFGQWLGYDFSALGRLIESRETLELNWSSLFALASVAVSYLMYRRYRVKSAGFVILPMMATIALVSPFDFGLFLFTAAIAYVLTALIQRYSMVIGTSRYALVSALSITLVWTFIYFLLHNTRHLSPYMGSGLFAALAVSVLVNEHTLYGVKRAFPVFLISMAVMACIEVGGSFLAESRTPYLHNLHYYVIHEPPARE